MIKQQYKIVRGHQNRDILFIFLRLETHAVKNIQKCLLLKIIHCTSFSVTLPQQRSFHNFVCLSESINFSRHIGGLFKFKKLYKYSDVFSEKIGVYCGSCNDGVLFPFKVWTVNAIG